MEDSVNRSTAERPIANTEPERKTQDGPALRQAVARAERAEAELAKLKSESVQEAAASPTPGHIAEHQAQGGEAELRNDSMMAHLLDSLNAGQDIGHYGRLVFAVVARHFMPSDQVMDWLMKDKDFDQTAATALVRQVEGRDYNPPKRDRILEWQAEQEFPILPHPEDPDCGNLYRNLKFPDSIYEHIEHYQEQKAAAE
jgi:hypothetical protein